MQAFSARANSHSKAVPMRSSFICRRVASCKQTANGNASAPLPPLRAALNAFDRPPDDTTIPLLCAVCPINSDAIKKGKLPTLPRRRNGRAAPPSLRAFDGGDVQRPCIGSTLTPTALRHAGSTPHRPAIGLVAQMAFRETSLEYRPKEIRLMKKIYPLFLIFLSLFIAPTSRAQTNPHEEFHGIKTFSLGLVGFAGHISLEEKIYRKIKQSPDAKHYFVETIKSGDSTIESKMYAMCGLRDIDYKIFKKYEKRFSPSLEASTMKGDILSKEKVANILYRIDKFGCNTGTRDHEDSH
ncbi:MchS3 family protein [Burkholderia theae]|uniref:MchS3 family protein n=1 Tax=Burkholderia theae TaxID=3143496 RepID=UPI003AFB7FCA